MNQDNNRIFSSIFTFFMKTEPCLIFWINWLSYFLAKYTSYFLFFDYGYGSKGANDVKNKIKVIILEY